MTKRDQKTAGELPRESHQGPDFWKRESSRIKAQKEREAELIQIESPILEDLRKVGLNVDSVDDLLRLRWDTHASGKEITQILLRWIPVVSDLMVREMLVRALGGIKGSFDGRPLIDLFETTQSETRRWVIANTLSLTRPTGVAEWLTKAVVNRSFGKSREMLLVAAARLLPREVANPLLASVFDEFPGHTAMALAKCGGEQELRLLREKRDSAESWVRKEIDKAIRAIEKNLARAPGRVPE